MSEKQSGKKYSTFGKLLLRVTQEQNLNEEVVANCCDSATAERFAEMANAISEYDLILEKYPREIELIADCILSDRGLCKVHPYARRCVASRLNKILAKAKEAGR